MWCMPCQCNNNYRYKDSLFVHLHHQIISVVFYKRLFDSSIQKRNLLDIHSSRVKLSASKKEKKGLQITGDMQRYADILLLLYFLSRSYSMFINFSLTFHTCNILHISGNSFISLNLSRLSEEIKDTRLRLLLLQKCNSLQFSIQNLAQFQFKQNH